MTESRAVYLRLFDEFRKRMVSALLFFSSAFFILLYFSNHLYTWLALPLLKQLPKGHGLIATNIAAPFFVPFELTFFVALFLTMPYFFYQIWAFAAPALYVREKKFVWPLLFMSTLLFYLGAAFAYFVIFPILFHFLTHTAPEGVMVSPDVSAYLDFTLKLFLSFGVIFEIPVITILLVRSKMVSREKLKKCRPYAIVGAFVIGMVLAPPDVFSQTVFAVPLWLLFESGIFLSRFFVAE